MISFELGEEQRLIEDTVRRLAAERLWPKLRETEAARALPDALLREVHALGVTTLGLPESAGGQGLGLVTQLLVQEALAWGDPAAPWALGGAGALATFVRELASEEQACAILSRFTPADAHARRGAVAWSEPQATGGGFMTAARREGDAWVLDGMKCFVVNGGVADRTLVFAQVDPDRGWDGIGAFVVPGDAAGLSAGPRRSPVGLDAAYVADLLLDSVRVPDAMRLSPEGGLHAGLGRAFLRHALLTGARAVGCAARAFELARAYCAERHAFGKPIGHFQAIAFSLADRLMDVESARWMLWRAASDWDRGALRPADAAAAAAHALEVALRCGDDGVQLHGGAGFIRDYAIEKLFRDARQIGLMGPSVQTLDLVVAETELDAAPDPSATWPSSDVQAICL